MGKKGSWFSAIKRAFTHDSKDKTSYGSDKRSSKEKKAGKGILQHGETKSLISRFREPSSIEKILGEADQLLVRPPTSSAETKIPPASLWRPASPAAVLSPAASHRASSPNGASQRVSSARFTSPRAVSPRAVLPPTFTPEAASVRTPLPPKASQSRWEIRYVQRPETTLRNQHRSATMIQAAFRGYLARRNFRALRGLVRLQGVVRSPNAQRQTMNAMKQMQLLVRVQTQIQSRRIQMLENQAVQHKAYGNNKEVDSNLSKWTLNQLPESGYNEDWDHSLLTKEEIEARLQKKFEAVIKRERAMAYAYSHQLWKDHRRSAESGPDIRSNGLPWWWNWLERQLPPPSIVDPPIQATHKTPPRPISEQKTRPQPLSSSRSAIPAKAKLQFQTTPPTVNNTYNSRPRRSTAAYDFPLRDDESLTTCPPFSTPNYMTPTASASAKAKVRASSNPRERVPGTPANDSKRRFSFSLTSNIGSFKWNKGTTKDSASHKQTSSHFMGGDLSVDSTVSMPAAVGRRPFNRFV
ncbi:hypothetical protein C2S51_020806 [Perilla frutescens var. frutescens]|nr:hypothetical protein C2S51_020806 [Perilla frutescens var. frutescens]